MRSTRGGARRSAGLVLLALAYALPTAAFGADALWGVELTLVASWRTPEEREAWRRSGFDAAHDDVAELYGVVVPPPRQRVVLARPSRLVRPPEAPERALLPVDVARGDLPPSSGAWGGRALLAALASLGVGALLAWSGRGRRRAGPEAMLAASGE